MADSGQSQGFHTKFLEFKRKCLYLSAFGTSGHFGPFDNLIQFLIINTLNTIKTQLMTIQKKTISTKSGQ